MTRWNSNFYPATFVLLSSLQRLTHTCSKVDEDDPVLEHIFQRYFAFGLFDVNSCRRTEHEEASEHEWKCFDSAIHSITTLSYVLDGVVTQMVDDIASFAVIEYAYGWRYDANWDMQTLSVTGPRHRKMSVSFAKVDAHWMASCQAANHALE